MVPLFTMAMRTLGVKTSRIDGGGGGGGVERRAVVGSSSAVEVSVFVGAL